MRKPFNNNYVVTRPFGIVDSAYFRYPGSRHPGTDYGLPANTQLIACIDGVITTIPTQGAIGRGNETIITNGDIQVKYCHQNKFLVTNGQKVKEGDVIGLSGYTGYVVDGNGKIGTPQGAHLHFEILINGSYTDPDLYIKEHTEDMGRIQELEAKVADQQAWLEIGDQKINKLTNDLALSNQDRESFKEQWEQLKAEKESYEKACLAQVTNAQNAANNAKESAREEVSDELKTVKTKLDDTNLSLAQIQNTIYSDAEKLGVKTDGDLYKVYDNVLKKSKLSIFTTIINLIKKLKK